MCGPKKSAWKWSLSKRYPEVWGAVHSHDCIEGIVPRHVCGVGREVVDRPLRSIIVNWTCIQCARLRAVRLFSVIQNMLKKHNGR